jgi:lipoprotein-releasing system permease protein
VQFAIYLTAKLLKSGKQGFSGPVIRVAVASVAVGLAVMILSVAIVTGFQQQIWDKVIGFGSHIRVTAYDNNDSYELSPIEAGPGLVRKLGEIEGVRSVSPFATKAGIIQSKDDFEGIVFKGFDVGHDWGFFSDRIVEGKVLSFADSSDFSSVLISRNLASRLKLKAGDPLRVYFVVEGEPQPRGRKFSIKGIYETGLGEMDELYVLGHISHLRKINDWADTQAGGLEILLDDFNTTDAINEKVYNVIGYDMNSRTISELYPQMFDWLKLQDMNVMVILLLMIVVSAMAMISILLILILEKAVMIGLLKSLGAGNASIRQVFLMHGLYILGKGMLWGNILGIGLCLVQQYTGLIKLPQESYFVSQVPINLQFESVLLLNAGTVVLCIIILLLPSLVISRISPVKTLRYS